MLPVCFVMHGNDGCSCCSVCGCELTTYLLFFFFVFDFLQQKSPVTLEPVDESKSSFPDSPTRSSATESKHSSSPSTSPSELKTTSTLGSKPRGLSLDEQLQQRSDLATNRQHDYTSSYSSRSDNRKPKRRRGRRKGKASEDRTREELLKTAASMAAEHTNFSTYVVTKTSIYLSLV